MTIRELCEPLFQYVCFLNRSGRKGGGLTFEQVRSEIGRLFDRIAGEAQRDARLGDQFSKLEDPLIFFVDSMIAESSLAVADRWHSERLAYDRGQLAGDERFFDLLDETLEDRSNEAAERLTIYYTCLGLGFTGMYANDPEEISSRMLRISDRVRRVLNLDLGGRVCPTTYDHVDNRNLIEPPGKNLLGMAIVLIGLSVVLFAAVFYLFREASRDLIRSLRTVESKAEAPAVPGEAETEKETETETEIDETDETEDDEPAE